MLRAILHKFWHKEDKENEASAMAAKSKAKKPAKKASKSPAKKTAKKAPAKKVAAKKAAPKAKAPAKKAAKKAAPAKKAAAKKAPAKKAAKKTAPVKKAAAKAPAKKAAKKAAPAKTATKKAPAKAAAKPKKAAAKKASPKKSSNSKLIGGIAPYREKKGENYMGNDQKDHFRGLLNTWKAELMEEVDRTVTHMKDEAANFPDPADRATQEEEFSLELRTRDRERKLIKKIDSTLELIEQDDYGYCEACGIEIGVQRLEARPTATLCIDCKTLAEIKEKQLGA